jgi:hypothetical protein
MSWHLSLGDQVRHFLSPLILISLSSWALSAGCHGRSTDPKETVISPVSEVALWPSSEELDFGSLSSGDRREIQFQLRNTTDAPAEVTEVRTSCDCLEILLSTKSVNPREEINAKAIIDMSHDPGFSGCLRLAAKGMTNGDRQSEFTIYANVLVRPSSAAEKHQ